MTFSIDSNVLIYAFEAHDPRHAEAYWIAASAFLSGCVLTNQALGEFLKVCSGRYPERRDEARQVVADWALLYPIVPTATNHLIAASALAERYRLQFWDALIIVVAQSAGADVLLTEDMQDGTVVNGVLLLNPFNSRNAELLRALLIPEP